MIGDRILQLIDYLGITMSAFEKKMGFSNASIRKVIERKGDLSSERLDIILKTYDFISAEWLLTGHGEMLKSQTSYEIVENTKPLTAHEPTSPIIFADANPAGRTDLENSTTMDWNAIKKRIAPNEYVRSFEVRGDSMEPNLLNGDLVFCTPELDPKNIQPDRVYVFETSTRGALTKRARWDDKREVFILRSDHPDYPTIVMDPDHVHEVWKCRSRMTWNMRDPNDLYSRLFEMENRLTHLESKK